ncbi:MAG: sigma-70 family RNA polymerase sigma factor [Planctomycetota bacterium]
MTASDIAPADYAALVLAAAAPAWRAARRVTRDDGLASDAVQEAFLRLVDGRTTLARLAIHGDRTQGVVALAVRVALDHERSRARRRAREERIAMERSQVETAVPSEGLEEREARRALDSALMTLPDRLRLAVELRFREGLSFAAIGHALGSSESTAHERVDAALGRLRRQLRPEGMSALVGIGEPARHLSPTNASASASVASNDALLEKLVDGLLGLPRVVRSTAVAASGGGGLVASKSAGWLLLLLALGGIGVWSATVGSRDRSSSTGAAAALDIPGTGEALAGALVLGREVDLATQEREAVTSHTGEQAAVSPFVLTGRVCDTRGHAVPGATVRASTVERSGKFPRWSGSAVADGEGAYRLVVPFGTSEGRGTSPVGDGLVSLERARLRLEAGHLGYVLRTDVVVDATRGAATHQDLVVALPPEERAGDYTLDVLVRDTNGAPVEGALVQLTHVAPRDRASVGDDVPFSAWSSQGQWLHLAEGNARTDASGRVTFAGKRLGPKSLWIEPRSAAAPLRTTLVIGAEGAHARDIELGAAHVLRGEFRWAGADALDAAEARALNVNVVLEPNRWRTVHVGVDGTFTVDALPAGPVTLRVAPNYDWPQGGGSQPSSVTLDLPTGDVAHVLELKREDDPRDVGLHDAELHGVAVDATTGEPVPIAGFDLFVWPLWDLPVGDLELDIRPNLIRAPPVQRAAGPGVARSSAEVHEVGLAAGPHMVQVSVHGRGTGLVGPIVLGAREVRAGLEVRVGPTATVEVTVVDPSGNPVEGAFVFVTGSGPHSDAVVAKAERDYRAIEGRGAFFVNGGRRTDAAGRAQLSGLPPGLRFTVAAVHPEASSGRSEAQVARPGDASAIDLVVGPKR